MLPIPTNQDCNRELKKIAAMAGIEKNVTFHVARHNKNCIFQAMR